MEGTGRLLCKIIKRVTKKKPGPIPLLEKSICPENNIGTVLLQAHNHLPGSSICGDENTLHRRSHFDLQRDMGRSGIGTLHDRTAKKKKKVKVKRRKSPNSP